MMATGLNPLVFSETVESLLDLLKQAIDVLPGPKHPATKYYNRRKQSHKYDTRTGVSVTSNAMRSRQKKSASVRASYDWQLAQYNFYNRRRKVWRQIEEAANGGRKECDVPIGVAGSHFAAVFHGNPCTRSRYDPAVPGSGDCEDWTITETDVTEAIKGIKIDTAPGPDSILMRSIREMPCSRVIQLIAQLMFRHGHVPRCLKKGRTCLIYKKGPTSNPKSWRPITIFSVIRRIINRILDRKLRRSVLLNPNHKGFTSSPGCHVNASLVNACLQDAKSKAKDCAIVFLDINKAFDSIGHDHLIHTVRSTGLPGPICDLVESLVRDNVTNVEIGRSKTPSIVMNCGVP